MSLNSFQSNAKNVAISNNGSTLECYDSSMEEKNVGCSSLRVRFRMITRKNDHFKARISSSISTSSMFSTTSTSSSSATTTVASPMLMNSASLATVANKDLSIGSSSSLSSFSMQQRQNKNPNFLEIKQNNQSLNHTVFFYNQQQKRHSHSISSRDLADTKSIPINIGLCKSTDQTSSATTKTFRLTEDLKSNIQFDITLKPTFSIRDDRLDASNSNLRSSSCDLNSSCSNFDAEQSNDNSNKRLVSLIRNSRQKEQLSNRDQLLNQNNKVYHHSSMIRLSINRCNGSNGSSGDNSPRNKSQTNINNLEIPLSTNVEETNKTIKRVVSPFTYIETYSTRRQMSISPHVNSNIPEPKQARIF